MAVDDLDFLHREMPELFLSRAVPERFDEDWAFERVRKPESGSPPLGWFDVDDGWSDTLAGPPPRTSFETYRHVKVPRFGETFPGAAVPVDPKSPVPPPDALGFYLPFHSYHPVWWGIYLVAEGVEALASYVLARSQGELSWAQAVRAAQLFIYFHEAFHHCTECFATRLEIVVRKPLKVGPFEALYRSQLGTGTCAEEALACGYALMKTAAAVAADRREQELVRDALAHYVASLPEDYKRGVFLDSRLLFEAARAEFAEENLLNALPDTPQKASPVWRSFPHAFSGIGRVNSRVNYIVHRSSPLFARVSAHGYFLTKRELTKRLIKLGGCRFDRDGGNHEVWIGPAGKFAIPRHPGDLATGTLSKIIKQAGLDMSVSQFVSAPV